MSDSLPDISLTTSTAKKEHLNRQSALSVGLPKQRAWAGLGEEKL